MKKLLSILAILGVILASAGTFFKFMHWPGADKLFLSGHLFLVIILLVWIFIRKRNALMTMLGITLLSVIADEVWIAMHWSYSRYTFGISIILVAVLSAMLVSRKD